MGCRVIFYGDDMNEIQNRLNGEFYQSMLQIDHHHRDSVAENYKVNILLLN